MCKNTADRIAKMRKDSGFEAVEVMAIAMGYDIGRCRSWENGGSDITFDEACDLCAFLGYSLDELAGDREMIDDDRLRDVEIMFLKLRRSDRDLAIRLMRLMLFLIERESDDFLKDIE